MTLRTPKPGEWAPVTEMVDEPYFLHEVGAWIPCKDRLPPEGSKDLLVCWRGTDRYERADYWIGAWRIDCEMPELPEFPPDASNAPTHWCRVQVPE